MTSTEPRNGQRWDDPVLAGALRRVRRHTSRARRRRCWAGLAAVVALLGAAGGAGALIGRNTGPRPVTSVVVAATDGPTGAGLTVTAVPMSWGTRLDVRLTGIAAGTPCRLSVRSTGGASDWVGSWLAGEPTTIATAVPVGELAEVSVRVDGGPLLRATVR
ncbi:hypothetical protein F0L68_38570 [Solihabitans fulvus]|uniref:Anti-sigma factor n=1 Tax=Solihabitans fulvus TaxID=1892852 RepID=A0A5B2WKE0_9PSEU|nr:hypothetical protein [Solihabitans fulvus]KAA2250926.1 hypothetical protein F0L68_38570 [Solihabitans fulvus]